MRDFRKENETELKETEQAGETQREPRRIDLEEPEAIRLSPIHPFIVPQQESRSQSRGVMCKEVSIKG